MRKSEELVDGAPDEAVARLITGAFLTGARYGELAEARVAQFDVRAKTLRVGVGKTGARTIILQTSAADFLAEISHKRDLRDFLFVRSDGSRWKKSDQTRPIKDALRAAELSTDGSLYALRHTYISRAIEGRVPLNIIADNCGTSVRMIERTYAKILAEKRERIYRTWRSKLLIENFQMTLDKYVALISATLGAIDTIVAPNCRAARKFSQLFPGWAYPSGTPILRMIS